jgi:hypothetical protein
MFFKVVENFLPKQVFDRLLMIVESEELNWHWSASTHYDKNKKELDSNFMLSKMIFNHKQSTNGYYEDKKYLQLFCLIADYQQSIKKANDLVRMKLNLYPNQGKNVKHVRHADMMTGKEIDDRVMTSIFNFHTCNGSTVIELGDKVEEVKSKANQLIMFDNTWHYGITQSDTPRRIVLNINVLK